MVIAGVFFLLLTASVPVYSDEGEGRILYSTQTTFDQEISASKRYSPDILSLPDQATENIPDEEKVCNSCYDPEIGKTISNGRKTDSAH